MKQTSFPICLDYRRGNNIKKDKNVLVRNRTDVAMLTRSRNTKIQETDDLGLLGRFPAKISHGTIQDKTDNYFECRSAWGMGVGCNSGTKISRERIGVKQEARCVRVCGGGGGAADMQKGSSLTSCQAIKNYILPEGGGGGKTFDWGCSSPSYRWEQYNSKRYFVCFQFCFFYFTYMYVL